MEIRNVIEREFSNQTSLEEKFETNPANHLKRDCSKIRSNKFFKEVMDMPREKLTRGYEDGVISETTVFSRFFAEGELAHQALRASKTEPKNTNHGKEFIFWANEYKITKELIAKKNYSLILFMARRTADKFSDFDECCSQSVSGFLDSIQYFNPFIGFKFSTYACRSMYKSIMRGKRSQIRYRKRVNLFPNGDIRTVNNEHNPVSLKNDDTEIYLERLRNILQNNIADLNHSELTIISYRFNINAAYVEAPKKEFTLEKVGKVLGVTKERARQIQNKALRKIRGVIEPEFDSVEL